MTGRVPGLVSVIIPAFNAERWLAAAVGSALAQSYRSFEVVVVDNGSTDGTADIARRTPGVRVVRCAARGPSAARNVGLDEARGEFVQFLDADDLLAPGKLERDVGVLRETGADVAWGAFTRFRDGLDADPFSGAVLVRPNVDPADVAGSLIRADGFIHLAASLFRRGAAVDGVRFDPSCRVVEDVRYLLGLVFAGARFVSSEGPPGFALREHDAPGRASRVDPASFWASCAENAELVRLHAARQGDMTPARVDTIAGVWLAAAEVFHAAGDPRLGPMLERLGRLDPGYRRRLRFPHRAVAPFLGVRATLTLARALRRARDAARGGDR